MSKKEKKITKKVQRQLDLLSKYYEIDTQNNVIIIKLHYAKASELFELDVVTKQTPKFKSEILARISELIESVPSTFKVDFAIKVDDYEGVKVDNISESFKDQLEMFNFQIYKVKSGRMLTAVILALVSVAILFTRQFLLNLKVLDDSILLTEMLDITAWVFLWEGVSTIFLRSDEYRNVSFNVIDHLKSFGLYDKEDKCLSMMSQEDIKKNWVNISRKEKNGKNLVLIAGAISFTVGIMVLLSIFAECFSANVQWNSFLISAVPRIIAGIIGIIGGLGAYSLYCESGKFQNAVPVIAYIYLIFDVLVAAAVIYSLSQGHFVDMEITAVIIETIMVIGASVIYFIGYRLLRKAGKENGEEDYFKL
ncbi:MAG: hypothetical protein MJ222_05315 [Bacilli bacterium]|nr:hypothetical protein [Bacilli bacterium]